MTRYLILLVATAAAATPACAQRFGGGGGLAAFDTADANHDGLITRAEFMSARTARFDTMDRNHDGVISKVDFKHLAKFRPQAVERIDAMIAQADANRDSRVTKAEMASAPAPIFDRGDTNGDGAIDKTELAALRSTLQAMTDGAN
jgi:Ca2+-binding EF-hand superfamily protein